MEDYLRRRRSAAVMDDLGIRLAIFLAAGLWFVYLWGLSAPAVLAGFALGLMGQLALGHYRRHTVDKREAALRQRLGGEIWLEQLMLQPAQEAHRRAAEALAQRYPLIPQRMTEDGALCRLGEETLLVSCLRKAPESSLSMEDVLAAQRGCLHHGAARCVICLGCKCPPAVEAFAEQGSVPVRLIARETMLALAGRMHPATDAQLLALKARRQRGKGSLSRAVLRKEKIGRYMFYGLSMLILHILAGWTWCALLGVGLVTLAVCSRDRGRESL